MATIKMTLAKVRNIRNLYRTGNWTHKQLAERYNCSRGHITKIVNQKRWDETKYSQL